MSAVKANGVLKQYLRNATYEEALNRIGQVARQQDRASRDELIRCRKQGFKVDERYRENLDKSKILATVRFKINTQSVSQKSTGYYFEALK